MAAAAGGGHSDRLDGQFGLLVTAVGGGAKVGNAVKTGGRAVEAAGVENIREPLAVVVVAVLVVVGGNVAPGGKVMYGNDVLRAIGGFGVGFFQS